MKLTKNILLAVDFSTGSSEAAKTAIYLSETLGARITPIHIVLKNAESTVDVKELGKTIDARLQQIVKGHGDGRTIFSKTVVRVGTPFDQILRYADGIGANGILLASRGIKNGDCHSLGVTATRIVRHSTRPVLVVGKGNPTNVKNILCPVDMSESSDRALKNAVHLARHFKATLTVIHVLKTSARTSEAAIAAQEGIARERRSAELDNYLASIDFHGITWTRRLLEGNPYDQIAATLADGDFDIVAMGTKGRSGIARLLIGGTVEKLTRNLPCSLLVVKSKDIIKPPIEDDLKTITETFDRAVALLEEGFSEEAIVELQKVTASDRFHSPAWEALAVAYDRIGDGDKSREAGDTARKIQEHLWCMKVRQDARVQWKKKL